MSSWPIDAKSVFKTLSELEPILNHCRSSKSHDSQVELCEVGNLHDNAAFLEIAVHRIKQDNVGGGVEMMMQLVAHLDRTRENKSSHCLLQVIEGITRRLTDRMAIASIGDNNS